MGPDWWAAWRDPDGRYVRQKVGTKRKAERIYRKVSSDIVEGKYVNVQPRDRHTLGELLDAWLAHREKVSGRESRWGDKSKVRILKKSLGSNKQIHTITERDIEAHRQRRAGLKPSTINRDLAVLSSALSWAIEKKWIRSRPRIKLPTPYNTMQRFLTREEAKRLIKECPLYLQRIVRTALATGMRRGEILAMRWRWVDLAYRVISIPGQHTKNGKMRPVPINNDCEAVLLEVEDRAVLGGPVLHAPSIKKVKADFRKARDRAGLRGLRFHDLRHTFASWLVQAGEDLYTVAEILGHQDVKMTRRYAHLAPDNLLRASLKAELEPETAIPTLSSRVIPFPKGGNEKD